MEIYRGGNSKRWQSRFEIGQFFYSRLGFFLRLVFVGYGKLACFLFTLEIRFRLFCLQWMFFTYGFPMSGNWVWSFLLTVPPP